MNFRSLPILAAMFVAILATSLLATPSADRPDSGLPLLCAADLQIAVGQGTGACPPNPAPTPNGQADCASGASGPSCIQAPATCCTTAAIQTGCPSQGNVMPGTNMSTNYTYTYYTSPCIGTYTYTPCNCFLSFCYTGSPTNYACGGTFETFSDVQCLLWRFQPLDHAPAQS